MFPKKHKTDGEETASDDESSGSSAKSSRGPSPRPTIERKARTRHLTESHSIDENDSAVVSHTN